MRPLTKILGIALILIAVFSVCFFFFYKRAQRQLPKQDLILSSAVLKQPLPKSNLVNVSGKPLEDEKLRRGKIVLVFIMPDCPPCDQENEFLKPLVGSRKDVSFYYIIPFGNKNELLKSAQGRYALEPFYDDGSNLSKKLDLYQVPIKVFLQDGIIEKTWVDISNGNPGHAEFKAWLNTL